jgi:hypothetical protein
MGVIGGAPKNGKSSLALELAVSLGTRTNFLGLENFPVRVSAAPVLYLQVENSAGRVQRDFEDVLVARGLGYIEEEVVGVDGIVTNPLAPEDEWEVVEHDVVARQFRSNGLQDLSNVHVLSNAALSLDGKPTETTAWLTAYIKEHSIRYLFLDPLYMLTEVEYEQKSGAIRPLFNFFRDLKNEHGCSVIVTHHQTSKHTSGSAASRLLGDTYIFGWYEAALFTSRKDDIFTLEVDSMRELGVGNTYTLTGRGFGSWELDPRTQDLVDALGRQNTKGAQMQANITKLGQLQAEHPDWTRKELGDALGVSETTIKTYRRALEARVNDE